MQASIFLYKSLMPKLGGGKIAFGHTLGLPMSPSRLVDIEMKANFMGDIVRGVHNSLLEDGEDDVCFVAFLEQAVVEFVNEHLLIHCIGAQ
eukprot:7566745-Ditylum_brightwellii.AAC.1